MVEASDGAENIMRRESLDRQAATVHRLGAVLALAWLFHFLRLVLLPLAYQRNS